jgi:hypothetical protein
MVVETDRFPVDGSLDIRTIGSVTAYDNRGHPSGHLYETDYGVDGTVDLRSTVMSVYDHRARPVQYVSRSDLGPLTPSIETHTLTYDSHGNVVLHISEGEYNFFGFIVEYGSRTAAEYSSHGALVSESVESGQEGSVDFSRLTSTIAFDQRGNPLERSIEEDRNGDGTWDSRESWTTEYDPQSRPVGEVRIFDTGAQAVTTYRYDGPGQGRLAMRSHFGSPVADLEEAAVTGDPGGAGSTAHR